eukprot:TRINITY_DN10884_c0_g1_i1.p1 TRINITY_DN10884_c0_g1~~TRINITY_DN10884_c0_g1_i1.p1  ORF type:complete len:514 (+),score=48.19 TRINITY_DN10884_c0_g1_i1:225-1544(+)
MEGMKFTQFYSINSICSPSRGCFLTGRNTIRNGIYTSEPYPEDLIFRVFIPYSTGGLPTSEVTVATQLKNFGYSTALIGKWHLGHYGGVLPTQSHGFDYWFGLPYAQDEGCPVSKSGEIPCMPAVKDAGFPGTPLYRNTEIIEQPVMLETLTERYNEEIESFLDNAAKNKSQPFFLYMAHNQVHVQLYASKNFLGKSKRGLYGDAAQEMDNSVGVLLIMLKSLCLVSNTFVFFSSDKGPWLEQKLDGGSAGPFKGGKGSTWEGGLRMPGIAWWPGKIPPMQVQQEVATSLDIFPTFLDVAGVLKPSGVILDGVSLVPLIFQGQPVHTNDVLFFYRDNLIYAARFQAFKAHFVTRSGFNLDPPVHHSPPLLFNVEQDPGEHWPLDPTESNNAAVLKIIIAAVENQQKTVIPATPQLNPSYMLDPLVSPCCNGTFPIGCSC